MDNKKTGECFFALLHNDWQKFAILLIAHNLVPGFFRAVLVRKFPNCVEKATKIPFDSNHFCYYPRLTSFSRLLHNDAFSPVFLRFARTFSLIRRQCSRDRFVKNFLNVL